MPRPRQIMRRRPRIDRNLDRMRPVRRRNSRRHTLPRLNALRKRRPKPRRVLLRHRPQPQIIGTLLGQGQTDQTPAILRHEVDRLRRNKLCSQSQVALVLAILVIHHDHHPTRLELRNRLCHVSKHSPTFPTASLSTHPILRPTQKRSAAH